MSQPSSPSESSEAGEAARLFAYGLRLDELIDLQDVLQLAVDESVLIAGADWGGFLLVQHGELGVELELTHPTVHSKHLIVQSEILPLALAAVSTKQFVEPAKPSSSRKAAPKSSPPLSVVCIPVIAFDTVHGVLFVAHDHPAKFKEGTTSVLARFAAATGHALVRTKCFSAIQEIGRAMGRMIELDHEIDSILQQITADLGFEFATISVKDEYRNVVESMRGKMAAWARSSSHDLSSNDIQACVLRDMHPVEIVGYDERLDPMIFARYAHSELARYFVPIIFREHAIGTIEAGCRIEVRDRILTPANKDALILIAEEKAEAVAQARHYVLVELIARLVTEILGAESASIHLYKGQTLFLAAGAGRASKEFVARFPPRPEGIGWRAIGTGVPEKIDDPEILAVDNAGIFEVGVRAIAALPLQLGRDVQGVLYVHFWRVHRFNEGEISLGMVLARQLEVAIQNTLRVKEMESEAEKAWTFAGLQTVVRAVASEPMDSREQLRRVLDEVAQCALTMFDADNVTLYKYLNAEDRFSYPPVMRGKFNRPDLMETEVRADDSVRRVLGSGTALFASTTAKDARFSGTRTDGKELDRFVVREGIRSTAMIPLRTAQEVVGLMFVNYREERKFDKDDENAMKALGSSAAIAIRDARLRGEAQLEARRREREQEAMRLVDQAIVEGAQDLRRVLEVILDRSREIIGAELGVLLWYDELDQVLKPEVMRGFPAHISFDSQPIDKGIVGKAARERRTILVSDVEAGEWRNVYWPLVSTTHSEIAVPLKDGDRLLGVINMEDPSRAKFTQDDRRFLETLAVQAVIAFHSVTLQQRNARRIQHLSAFSQTARQVHATRELDLRLRLLLTGVTSGEGLSFSRAMLFLKAEDGQLRGHLAIGALTRKEAQASWDTIVERRRRTSGEEELLYQLSAAQEFGNRVAQGLVHESDLCKMVRRLRIPVEVRSEDDQTRPDPLNLFAACMEEARTIPVEADARPSERAILQSIYPVDEQPAFVLVPLQAVRGTRNANGVLLVDNTFLPNQRQIDSEDIDSLKIFAELAALCIEADQYRIKTMELKNLEEWRNIANIIGSRLADLSATIRKNWGLGADSQDGQKEGLAAVNAGLNQIQVVLGQFRRFADPPPLKFTKFDLVQLLRNVCRRTTAKMACRIEQSFSSNVVIVNGDSQALFVSFSELLDNAALIMSEENSLGQMIELSVWTENDQCFVEVYDTGPGVRDENKSKIFDPLFTTRPRGNGLGLAMVKKIMAKHGGVITEVGVAGSGARFRLSLPLATESFGTDPGTASAAQAAAG